MLRYRNNVNAVIRDVTHLTRILVLGSNLSLSTSRFVCLLSWSDSVLQDGSQYSWKGASVLCSISEL